MKKLTIKLSIELDAPKEKVWDVLLQDKSYRIWTSVFHPGSYVETDWKQGTNVLFKTPEGSGLVSTVLLHQPQEIISFQHAGVLKNGVEDFDNDEVKNWRDFKETYVVKEKDGITQLFIDQDITEEHADGFSTTWKKALQKIKELSEAPD